MTVATAAAAFVADARALHLSVMGAYALLHFDNIVQLKQIQVATSLSRVADWSLLC